MGFFNKKDDTVMLPEKFKNSVIYPISNSMYTVNLGQNIVVGDGWNAVFVVKEKPREILPAGAHELSLPNLPNITRLLKLDQGKVNKKSDKVMCIFFNVSSTTLFLPVFIRLICKKQLIFFLCIPAVRRGYTLFFLKFHIFLKAIELTSNNIIT